MQNCFLMAVVAMLANADPGQFLPKDFLVEVEVVESRIGKDVTDVKLKIIHVYAGPQDLKDVVFSLNKDAIGQGVVWHAQFPIFQPPIEKLEKSIILVRYDKDHVVDIAPRGSPESRL